MSIETKFYEREYQINPANYLTETELGRLSCVNKHYAALYSSRMHRDLPTHTTLSDLQSAIQPIFRKQFDRIAQTFWETIPKAASNNCGKVYPIFPEILQRAIQLSQGQEVLEIAGAGGENALLLSLSEAKHVYMNDICSMEKFHSTKSTLPNLIQQKVTAISGDFFKILAEKPELEGRIGLILCRNFLHFVHPKKQTQFLNLVKRILKPGGRAIFTVNSTYATPFDERALEKSSHSSFRTVYCTLTNRKQRNTPKVLYYKTLPLERVPLADSTFTGFDELYLYEKDVKTNFKWKVDNAAFHQVDKALRKEIKTAIQKEKEAMKAMLRGSVRVVTCYQRYFTFKKLNTLFHGAGFQTESSFAISALGHLEKREKIKRGAQIIGVIVRR